MNKIGYQMIATLLLGFSAWLWHGPAYAGPPAITGTVGTLKVERHGDHGRPVILIPGLEGGPWVWERTIGALQKDHVVYAVTLAGFDGMPAPAGGGNLLDRADTSLKQLIEQRKIDKPVLVGHSLGGTLALRFAGEHPQMISGVVAVDGWVRFTPAVSKRFGVLADRQMQEPLTSRTSARPDVDSKYGVGTIGFHLTYPADPSASRWCLSTFSGDEPSSFSVYAELDCVDAPG